MKARWKAHERLGWTNRLRDGCCLGDRTGDRDGAGAVGNPPPTEGPRAEFIKAFQERINNGIDPLYVGELVCEAIENDWPYIFTDTEHEPFIDKRFAAIKQGFECIRGRMPRH